MSPLEGVALVFAATGIYILVSQPASGRRVRIGSVSINPVAAAGVVLAAAGLLMLLLAGAWPADWWRWDESALSSRARQKDSPAPGPMDLLAAAPGFWIASVVAVAGAVGIVAARTALTLRVSLIVFAFAAAIVVAIAFDLVGASVLCAVGLAAAWPLLRGSHRAPEDGNDQQTRVEPLLATIICVLLAWGLVRGLHVSATFEAGPDLSASGTDPALPRPVREATRKANADRNEGTPKGKGAPSEYWLLGISIGVMLVSGFLGSRTPLSFKRPEDSAETKSLAPPVAANRKEH